MKLTFEKLCELGMKAREIAVKLGHEFAGLFLKAHGVVLREALAIFHMPVRFAI